jgi:hypothetical protein
MTNEILNIIPGLQSTALMSNSLRLMKAERNPKKANNMFLKTTAGTLAGIGLMGATAGTINKL